MDATIEIIKIMVGDATTFKALTGKDLTGDSSSDMIKSLVDNALAGKTVDSQDVITALKALCDVSDFLSTKVCPFIRTK